MARMNAASRPGRGTATWTQFAAIANLRWRVFANGLRRRGGKAELAGRILLLPLIAALIVAPSVAAGFTAWYFVSHAALAKLSLIFWAALVIAQLVNLNLGTPGTTFDPTELIRFPLSLPGYVFVRLCFGLLSPGNLIVTLMSVAIFVGVTIAQPALWPWALLATAAFALANVLFTRMIFAWVDRWLSTRRAREIFTAIIFLGSIGLQYINVNYNPGFQHGQHHRPKSQVFGEVQHTMVHLQPWLRWLPPELSAKAIIEGARQQAGASFANSSAVLLYAGIFLAIYATRMRTEYRGENLSDAANAVRPSKPVSAISPHAVPAVAAHAHAPVKRGLLPATLGPLLSKELLLLRRNVGLLYGVVAPTVMVFLFAGRVSMRNGSHWLLFLAVSYALLGIAPLSFNSLGMDATGAQFYFLAPVPLSEVFFAKNVMGFLLALVETAAVILIVALVAVRPSPADVIFAVVWVLGALLFVTTVGNLRSVAAPKRVLPGRSIRRAQSQVSVWMSLGILAACAGLAALMQLLAWYLHTAWLGLLLVALFAAAAAFTYAQGLRHIERYAMEHRDTLFEELGKKT